MTIPRSSTAKSSPQRQRRAGPGAGLLAGVHGRERADHGHPAQEALADATLKAPIAGLVIAVNGQVGDTVSGTNTSSSSTAATASGSRSAPGSSGSTVLVRARVPQRIVLRLRDDRGHRQIHRYGGHRRGGHRQRGKSGRRRPSRFPAISSSSTRTATVTAIAPTGTTSNSIVTYATTITLTDPPTGPAHRPDRRRDDHHQGIEGHRALCARCGDHHGERHLDRQGRQERQDHDRSP